MKFEPFLRVRPVARPYWVLPGGHVESDDPDRSEYRLEEVPTTTSALDAISLEPEQIAALLRSAATSGTRLNHLINLFTRRLNNDRGVSVVTYPAIK